MKNEIKPGDLVVPKQFIDHTHKRPSTFFGDGIVAHVLACRSGVPASEPRFLAAASREAGATIHEGGTYLCIEGAAVLDSRGIQSLSKLGVVDVISMTAMQEARLAREAELCYSTLVLVTDYDCWHETVSAVDIGEILRVMRANVETAQKAVMKPRARVAETRSHLRMRVRTEGRNHHRFAR